MGCSDCASKGGCSTRKGQERELLASLLPALYPGKRWGEPDDAARFRAGIGEREGRRLARQAAQALRAPAFFRPGDDSESCDYVYILCVGRRPALLELRERPALEVPDGDVADVIEERYLRAALSSMARVAAVQEVIMELRREPATDGDAAPAGYAVREKPRDGVYDPILLRRTQSLIELLVANDITYLDFGLLVKPVSRYAEGFSETGYEERFGQSAATVNYLFYPQPPTAVSLSWVAACAP